MDCGGCLKYLRNPEECIQCAYGMSSNIASMASIGEVLSGEAMEEVTFDIFSKIRNEKKEAGQNMSLSMLAKVLGKCSDTAIFLSKTRMESRDEFRCILFDIARTEAYITNGDAIIRISDLNGEVVYGLCDYTPAYDYMSESFIPNPLPWSTEELSKEFGGEYYWTFSLPIDHILTNIQARFPDPVSRRMYFSVFDVGYSHPAGSMVIPSFDMTSDVPIYISATGKPVYVSPKSQISKDFINPGVSYVGVPEVCDDAIYVDVYKVFGETLTMGMYKILPDMLADDLNPFFLEGYPDQEKLTFKLLAEGENYVSLNEKYRAYANFEPFALEMEFLYETLVLFKSFGYNFVNIHSKGTNNAVAIEGIRESPDIPIVEACLAPVIVGNPGTVCETILDRQLVG